MDTTIRCAAGAAVCSLLALSGCSSNTHAQNPEPAAHAAPVADWIGEYPERFPGQVAVFLTQPGETALGLRHALSEMGIPFFCTRDLDQALRHPLLILYPAIEGQTVTLQQAEAITRFVENGGSVYAQNVFWGPLKPLFGFRGYAASRQRHRLQFLPPDPILAYLDRPEEQSVRLGDERIPEIIWSNSFEPNDQSTVLARFEDGGAGLLVNRFGKGKAYLAGVSLEDVVVRNQSNHDYEAQRSYVNAFEPGADVWLLLLRAWYQAAAQPAVRLATIPRGARSALLLSHDLDSGAAFEGVAQFIAMESRHAFHSTLFLQTKYFGNSLGPALWTEPNIARLPPLAGQGTDLESHSVMHALSFNTFPLGTGKESVSTYHPVADRTGATYQDGSVMGELNLSKSLLDAALPGHVTVFFRAGHLRVPPGLPEAEMRLGYEFDSSFTSPDVLTNFPYRLPLGLTMDRESPILEFPVTFEDEQAPGLAGHVAADLAVLEANADNGAMSVLLVHTNDPGVKVPAEEALLSRLPPGIEVSDMLTFARFWQARERLQWRVELKSPGELELDVTAPLAIDGVTFELGAEPADAAGIAGIKLSGQKLILPALAAGQTVKISVRYRK